MIDSTLELEPNYRLLIADERTTAAIFLESKGYKKTAKRIQTIIESMRSKESPLAASIAKAMGEYTGKLLEKCRIIETHNKIPNVLRYELAKLLAGQTVTPTFKANYVALGNWSTAVSDNDTALDNELIRWTFTQRTAVDNVTYLDRFFSSSEVWGMTIIEAGVFVDGTAAADSGYLLSRVNLLNISMSATETLTINVTLTLNSAT